MFILAVGPLARATVGPVERLLNMVGEQRVCALVYAAAFVINHRAVRLLLIPLFGVAGAAIAISIAMILESVLLFFVTKQRLGLHVFIWRSGGALTRARATIDLPLSRLERRSRLRNARVNRATTGATLPGRALEPNVFYEPAFALAAAPVFGRDAHAILIWSRQPQARLVGLFPVETERRYGDRRPCSPAGPIRSRRSACLWSTATWRTPRSPPGSAIWRRTRRLPSVALLPIQTADGAFRAALNRVLAARRFAARRLRPPRRAHCLRPAGPRRLSRARVRAKKPQGIAAPPPPARRARRHRA